MTTRTRFTNHETAAWPSEPCRSTLWRRTQCKPSRKNKAAKQQDLSPCEKNALVDYVLRTSERGYPLPVKFLRFVALVIARQRSSAFRTPSVDDITRLPVKNQPQDFYKRHPELTALRVKALDWAQHDHNVYNKVTQWFSVIGKELHDPVIVSENVHNMDVTSVLLSVLSSLKILVGKEDVINYRGTAVTRTLIIAIEFISADGRCLFPPIVWPTSTYRSTWTTHPTPG